MGRLIFSAAALRPMLAHSRASNQESIYGKVVNHPSLVLVHDQGVYLMSNGTPRQKNPKAETDKHEPPCLVTYARGCHPRNDPDWYDTSRDLVGGDDFAEPILCADLDVAVNPECESMVIDVGSDNIEITAVLRNRRVRNPAPAAKPAKTMGMFDL